MPAWFKVIDYRKVFAISTGSLWDQPGHQPDPELLAKPEPHYSVKMLFSRGNIGNSLCLPARPAEPFEVRYDQNGFRNDKDLASAEIAVIGDSYIESEMFPRYGSKIRVLSQWDMQENSTSLDQSITVIESNCLSKS